MEKIEETIKEIAVKHGIAVGRDDPIMILHTINERLMKETAVAQRQILHEFKEELESAAHEWEINAKGIAEKILNTALIRSKETMENTITEGGKEAVKAMGKEINFILSQANTNLINVRILAIINALAVVLTLLALAVVFPSIG